MPIKITTYIPGMLTHCTGGEREVAVRGATVRECIDNLMAAYPLLKVHIFEEDGTQRKHVHLYYNQDNLLWIEDWNIPVKNGDAMMILQAVSGG